MRHDGARRPAPSDYAESQNGSVRHGHPVRMPVESRELKYLKVKATPQGRIRLKRLDQIANVVRVFSGSEHATQGHWLSLAPSLGLAPRRTQRCARHRRVTTMSSTQVASVAASATTAALPYARTSHACFFSSASATFCFPGARERGGALPRATQNAARALVAWLHGLEAPEPPHRALVAHVTDHRVRIRRRDARVHHVEL